MRYLSAFTILLLMSFPASPELLTERRMSSADIGTVVFMAPAHWKGFESYAELEAAAVYQLSSRREKFSLRLSAKHFDMESTDDGLVERLDAYLKYTIADYLEDPDKYEVRAARFGPQNHGIYARIAHRHPDDNAYPYFTHGARILDDMFIVFSLHSNDHDMAVLESTLELVTSVEARNEWADAPDSYICNVDQVIGFGIVDDEWDAVSSKKVKHKFVLRRSEASDVFADKTEWVFVTPEQEHANTFCDNEFIARGFFLCSGEADEEFRMDSNTLRFVYVYLGGYYDVPQDTVPDEDSPKPQMGIGSCTAQ